MSFEAQTISTLAIVFLAMFIRGTFGFGGALVAMPLLVLTLGVRLAAPLIAMVAETAALIILLRNWRHVRFQSAWRLVASSAVGVPLGVLFLKGLYEGVVTAALAVVIIGFSSYSLFAPRDLRLRDRKSAYLFGFVAGILGGAYNTNGPPIAVYGTLRQWTPRQFRATLQGYFFPTGLFILAGHAIAGLWTQRVFHLYLGSLPVIVTALALGSLLNRILPTSKFLRYIHVLLIAIAAYLLVHSVRGL